MVTAKDQMMVMSCINADGFDGPAVDSQGAFATSQKDYQTLWNQFGQKNKNRVGGYQC